MGKMKTHKAASKRFSFSAGGKIKMNHSGRRHKTGLKPSKTKRNLRKRGYASETRLNDIKRMLPYG